MSIFCDLVEQWYFKTFVALWQSSFFAEQYKQSSKYRWAIGLSPPSPLYNGMPLSKHHWGPTCKAPPVHHLKLAPVWWWESPSFTHFHYKLKVYYFGPSRSLRSSSAIPHTFPQCTKNAPQTTTHTKFVKKYNVFKSSHIKCNKN